MSERRSNRLATLVVATLCLAASLADSPQASAQAPEATRAAPLALTISGGGTKGPYMAGHLYYTGLMARETGRFEPRVFTGASAGAINSMAGVLTACSAMEPDPTRSLYWNAWTSVGIAEVFVREKTTADGLMTTDAYAPIIADMRAMWDAGLPTACDVLLGVVVTRTQARTVTLAPGFPPLPVSRETVLLRITGQGPGRPPRLRNQVDATRAVGQLLLPLDGTGTTPFDALADVVIASAAFPVGFAPATVRHCVYEPGTEARCTPQDAVSATFMDGGVFDNQPLGLAIEAMQTLGDGPSGEGRFYFLDPRVRAYPVAPEAPASDADAHSDLLSVMGSMMGLMATTESRELIGTFERKPQLRDRLLLARTYFPQSSSTFTGLLDRGFRAFDFYLGMYNAARTIREHPLGVGAPEVDIQRLSGGDPGAEAAWTPFLCLRAVLDGVGDEATCDGDDLTDFRILLQQSLDRLTAACRHTAEAEAWSPERIAAVDHPACRAAMQGAPTPQVPGVRRVAEATKAHRVGESPLLHQLRMLGEYGYHFRDLGLERDEADQAVDQVIRLASRMLQRFSDVQPRVSRPMAVLARIGIEQGLGYLPPVHSFHVTGGMGAELGYSGTLDDRRWNRYRLGAALAFDGLSTFLNPSADYLAVIPKIGPEVEVVGRPEMQVRLGARVGYQFSTADDFGGSACDFALESSRPCSRPLVEAYAATSVLGFLRFQLAGVYEPGLRAGQSDYWALRPTVGMQLNSPF